MMRLSYPAYRFMLFALVAQGCVNKDDPNAVKPFANFVFEGLNYSSFEKNSAGTNGHFTNGAKQGVWARFSVLPNGSIASYKIIECPANTLANNEMVLQVDNGANESCTAPVKKINRQPYR